MPRRSASSAQTTTIQPIGHSKLDGDFLRIAMGTGTLAEKAAAFGVHKNTYDKERKARADQIALQTRIELDENVHRAMATLVDYWTVMIRMPVTKPPRTFWTEQASSQQTKLRSRLKCAAHRKKLKPKSASAWVMSLDLGSLG